MEVQLEDIEDKNLTEVEKKENEGWQTFWKMKTGMRRTTSE